MNHFPRFSDFTHSPFAYTAGATQQMRRNRELIKTVPKASETWINLSKIVA
jgi:hypothetical protein